MSFSPRLSVSGCAGVRLDPFPEGPLLPRTPANQRGRAGPVAAGSYPLLGDCGVLGAPAGGVGFAPGSGPGIGLRASCDRLGARGRWRPEREAEGLRVSSRVPPGATAWQSGTTPHFVLVFRFICAPFSFLSPSEKEKPNKRVSLFLFRACKVEDI